MRHYEIVLLIHPDQSEQVPAMLERYKGVVTAGGGKVHRVEDWGRRQMAYMIQKLAKAHYLCINIECGKAVLAELETGFRFNDAVLRHLTVMKSQAETTPSVMMKMVDREDSPQRAAAAGGRGLSMTAASARSGRCPHEPAGSDGAAGGAGRVAIHPGRAAGPRFEPQARIAGHGSRPPRRSRSRSGAGPSVRSRSAWRAGDGKHGRVSPASSDPSATAAASFFM